MRQYRKMIMKSRKRMPSQVKLANRGNDRTPISAPAAVGRKKMPMRKAVGEAISRRAIYEITPSVNPKQELGFKRAIVMHGLRKLLVDLGQEEMIFVFKNAYVPMEDYMESILLKTKVPELTDLTGEYNRTLSEAASRGHNNFTRKMYLETDAGAAEILQEDLKELYGYEAHRVRRDGWGDWHPSQCEVPVSPSVNTEAPVPSARHRRQYTKRLYLYNIPPDATDTLFNDLLGVAADSELVIRLQKIDPFFAEQAIAEGRQTPSQQRGACFPSPKSAFATPNESSYPSQSNVNTSVWSDALRDSVAEEGRLAHEPTGRCMFPPTDKENYFLQAVLPVIAEAKKQNEPLFLATFTVFLYGDTEDELSKDARLLITSALKYGGMVREGDGIAPRVFSTVQIASMLPMNIQSAFEKRPMLQGVNPVNDSLILTDRGNSCIGFITGTDNSGKTSELKRAVVHALLTSDDDLYVVTPFPEEWQDLTNISSQLHINSPPDFPPVHDPDYGLTRPREVMEAVFSKALDTLQTYVASRPTTGSKVVKRRETGTLWRDLGSGIYASQIAPRGEVPVSTQIAQPKASEVPTSSPTAQPKAYEVPVSSPTAQPKACEEPVSPPKTNKAQASSPTAQPTNGGLHASPLSAPSGELDLLLTLDTLWNAAIKAKKKNKGIQIFIDGIDPFFYSTAISDYLLVVLSGCEVLHVPVTLTVQNAAAVCGDPDAVIEFECFLRTVTYAKLLNQGPMERKLLQKSFALPDALVQGVTDQSPGCGILITPEKTVRFTTEGL